MADFILGCINSNFVLIFLGFLVLLTVSMKPKVSDVDFRPMYLTVISIFLFVVLDRIETLTASDPSFHVQRLILSVLCYWLRPVFSLGLIYVIVTEKKKRLLILIPEIINILVMGTAFLPGIGSAVIYFDDGYGFRRGPLGYTVFIVGFLYVLILLYLVFFCLREKNSRETLLIVVCAVFIIASSVVEAVGFIYNTTSTMVMISCLVYYLTIYFQLTSVDALTGLYNRETFYQDSRNQDISAVASVDMNGLKRINDSEGHKAGDTALASIAGVIRKHARSSSRGYRVGGDEFIIVFRKMKESAVRTACEQIRDEVEQTGYSVAIGYAYANGENVEELMRISDEKMYADKSAYYERTGSGR